MALASTKVPLRAVWGLDDAVSGAPMLKRLREVVPGVDAIELPGVRHYPHWEVPARVAAHVLG